MNRFSRPRGGNRGGSRGGPANRKPQHTNFHSSGQIAPTIRPLITPSIQQQQNQQQQHEEKPFDDTKMLEEQLYQLPNVPTSLFSSNNENLIPVTTATVKNENMSTPGPIAMDVQLEVHANDEDQNEPGKEKQLNNTWTKRQRINNILNKVKPKSSMAVLNEIYTNVTYDVLPFAGVFNASANVNGTLYHGSGQSKAAAQSAAAEDALKHLILGNTDIASARDTDDQTVGHSHLLSYALFKLLNSWDESGNMVHKLQQTAPLKAQATLNPAKKLPPNPEKVHPVMLLSQTNPHAEYTEIGNTQPPNCMFTIQCAVNGKLFIGTGPNKKMAKKMAAMKACTELLGVKYDE